MVLFRRDWRNEVHSSEELKRITNREYKVCLWQEKKNPKRIPTRTVNDGGATFKTLLYADQACM